MSAAEMGQGEGTLSKGAALVADAKVDFDRISNKLDGQIQGLRGRWQGAGGTAFFTLHQAWTEKQKVIVQALNEFESVVDRHRARQRLDRRGSVGQLRPHHQPTRLTPPGLEE